MLSHDLSSPATPPQLSLCIPTYNRASLLQEALEAIAGQGDAALFAAIEIIVSDNASPDDTFEVIQAVVREHPYLTLHYFRQPENVGVNQNLYDVVQRATGEFVWILSDDDVLLPGALDQIFALRRSYPERDAFCLNMRTFQSNPHEEENRPVLALEKDTLLPDRDDALLLFGTWITFISIVVFRKSALTRMDYDQRIDTWLGYCYQFLDTLSHGTVVLCRPYLAVRDNYRGGYNFFEVFVTQFQEMLNYAEKIGYSSSATHRVFQRHLRVFLLPFLLTFKRRELSAASAMNYQDGLKRLLRAYPGEPLLLVVLPLLLTPAPILRIITALRHVLKTKP